MAIIVCTCQNAQQDKMYGKKHRVANKFMKSNNPAWRCTVCKSEVDSSKIVKE